jgi:NAD(P)-dependent dehydrogenase (short-subunit alcohol dehydrogenase family)
VARWSSSASDRVAICGDVIRNLSYATALAGIKEPPPIFTYDMAENRRSIRKLAGLSPALILAGHGPEVRDMAKFDAGRTQAGAVEETTDEELRALFDLHFFAPAALTRAVLPHMRRQGGGAIVQMSSVDGQVTAPGFGAYCATKFALEGFTETLRDEVAGFGIHTLIVEPGAFRTGLFRPGAAYESAEMLEYADTVGPTRAYVRDNHGAQPGDPAKAAEAIMRALDADQPPLRLVLGADAIANIEGRLEGLSSELAAWREVGRATALNQGD